MPKTVKKSVQPQAEFALDMKSAPVANPKGIEPLYSNNATLLVTPHDIRILFAEVVSYAPFQPPTVELRANITMSPTQFKAFADAVAKTLEGFQKSHGEIVWPPKNQPKSQSIN